MARLVIEGKYSFIMGKYNFDELTHRRGTNCVKWDAESPVGPIDEDVIPMWVADMDFKVYHTQTERTGRYDSGSRR